MNGITAALTGRVTLEPERKWTRNGKEMLQVNVVVDQNMVATEDRAAPEPCYVRATIWGDRAAERAEQLRKGSLVYLEGRLSHGTWTASDGSPRCGLNLSAWRCEQHGAIGKNAPRREAVSA